MRRYLAGLKFLGLLAAGLVPSHHLRRWIYRGIFRMKIAPGAVIYGGAEIRAPENIAIGPHAAIGHYAKLDGRGGLEIGRNVNLSSGVWIWTADHDPQSPDFATRVAGVVIEDDAWLSCRVTVLPGVRIGKGAVIAAGAVVTQDVPAYTIAGGVPARFIAERTRDLKYELDWYQPFF